MANLTPRVLVVAPYTPSAMADHGSAVALRGALRSLATRTTVVAVHPADATPIDPALDAACAATATFPVVDDGFAWRRDLPALLRGRMLRSSGIDLAGLAAQVDRLVAEHDIDVVRVDGIEVADVLPRLRTTVRRVVVVYEPVASTASTPATQASLGHRLVARLDARGADRQETRAMRAADLVVAFTERDAEALAAHGSSTPVTVIPLGWDVQGPSSEQSPTVSNTIVFVGNFVHRPNVDAATRLASSILPRVTAQIPDVVLRLVGAHPPAEVRALADRQVTVTGRVDVVRSHLDEAAVVVAPIHTGGGSRVKVLEALAAGAAVVATPRALEGIDAPADAVVPASSDAAFADAVVALLRDPVRRAAIGVAARRWAETQLSWDRISEGHLAHYAELPSR